MQDLNQESSSDSQMAGSPVSLDQQQQQQHTAGSASDFDFANGLPRTAAFASDDELLEEGEFTSNDGSRFWSFLRYNRSILVLIVKIALELLSAKNQSIVSWMLRICLTGFVYTTVYTSTTGMLMWAMAYLMDHKWYLLAVSSTMVMLMLSCILLVALEWMWLWQRRASSWLSCSSNTHNYHRLRSLTVLEDDEMEDDLTLKGWIRLFLKILLGCLVWSLYCYGNLKVDFWITDHYVLARPQHFSIELRLVNCLEAAPVLLGSAVLLYFMVPSFYQWNFEAYAPNSTTTFASTEDIDNEGYTIPVNQDDDNDTTTAMGMQNLII